MRAQSLQREPYASNCSNCLNGIKFCRLRAHHFLPLFSPFFDLKSLACFASAATSFRLGVDFVSQSNCVLARGPQFKEIVAQESNPSD
jgi:hypothetical protein